MRTWLLVAGVVVGASTGCDDDVAIDVPAGGDTTIDNRSSNAFSLPAANLDDDALGRHIDGDVRADRQRRATFHFGTPARAAAGTCAANQSATGASAGAARLRVTSSHKRG